MTRRFTLLVSTGLLAVPGLALAYYPPGYCPPPRYVPCPPVTYVCPSPPVVECPPATTPPAKPLNPPKVMEKPEAPEPKAVKPAAAAEPMPMKKPDLEKPEQETPKGELAIPSPAVPETPAEKPKPPEPAPFTLPPIDAPKKKDETPPKLELPSAKSETPPKVDIPPITLPPTTIVPVKSEEKPKPPEIVLPKISESKYTPTEPKVRVVPVEGRRSAGDQTVNLYNYTDRDLQLQVGGKATKLPAKSLLALTLPDAFAWKFGEKAETITIPADAAGLSIIIQ